MTVYPVNMGATPRVAAFFDEVTNTISYVVRDPHSRICPLTVERGKIVLAEFGYGGVMQPSFPKFLIDGTKPSRLAWVLKEKMLPPIYWKAMLRGREWMARPEKIAARAGEAA